MIEKVGYSNPLTATRNVRRANATGGTAFASALSKAEGAGGGEPPSSIAAMNNVVGLLGVQEMSEEEHRRRKAVKRGRLTLDALAQLRDALLTGELPIATLRNLEKTIATERAATDDPKLAAILDEIEVRAAVELAKLEMAGLL